MVEQEVVEKFSWAEYIEKIEAEGYELLNAGKCPNCGSKAVHIHHDGVIHGKCESCSWSDTGFGGPTVRSWSGAVAWGNLSEEERKKQEEEQKKRIERKTR